MAPDDTKKAAVADKPVHMRLMELDEDEIKALNCYQLLGLEEPHRATPHSIKQAYRKASIRYHPDKTGREDNDYVFIAVKSAWDTLSDLALRKAYDSTEMPFDDTIPPDVANAFSSSMTTSTNGENGSTRGSFISSGSSSGVLYTDDDFYDTFGPVFERNLRFDTRLQEVKKKTVIPELGDVEMPIEKVQAFYDYWVQFDSWRDFSSKAQEELFDGSNPLEDAESRYEKRFYQKEVDKKAKSLKRAEMSRIQTLVSRAMAADPRLVKHYREQKEAKEKAIVEKKLKKATEERDAKEAEEKRQKDEAEQNEKDKVTRASDKVTREKEKKLMRKAKQQLRKITVAQFQEQTNTPFKSLEEMSDEVEYLCGELNLLQIQELTETFTASKDFSNIHSIAQEKKGVQNEEQAEKKAEALEKQQKREDEDRRRKEEIAVLKTWTQPELTSLAKAVKKFPGGGGRRWEQIASYINSNCRPDDPRTNKDCLDKYNQINKASAAAAAAAYDAATASETAPPAPAQNGEAATNGTANGSANDETDEWTEDQDTILQDALTKFPASLDKNERWASIAKMVSGKSKKQCVERFKSIRDAIKSKN